MRHVQLGILILSVALFLLAALFTGQETGDVLWRAGIAATLIDLLFVNLYPPSKV